MMDKSRDSVKFEIHKDLFNIFEEERKKEQIRLEKKIGGVATLTQRQFTKLIAKKGITFNKRRKKK